MSRQTINAILIALATGVLANFVWMWIEPWVPRPHVDSQVANTPSTAGTPSALKKSIEEAHQSSRPPGTPLSVGKKLMIAVAVVVEIILCLWLVILPLQVIVDAEIMFGSLFDWLDDNVHRMFWLMVVPAAVPFAFFYAVLLAELHATVVWFRIVRRPFHAES